MATLVYMNMLEKRLSKELHKKHAAAQQRSEKRNRIDYYHITRRNHYFADYQWSRALEHYTGAFIT